jgi:hypothetical protein
VSDPARVAECARLGLERLRAGKRQEQLVVAAEREPCRRTRLVGQRRREQRLVGGDQRARQGDDRRVGFDDSTPCLDANPPAAVIDARDGAVEGDVKAGAMGGDRRAVAFEDTPVDAVVGVAAEVARRDARQFRAAIIAADRVDQRVPSPARFEQVRQRAVGFAFRQRVGAFMQRPQRGPHCVRLGRRQARLRRRARPRRRRAIDRPALRLGDRRPRIALGRMQPAATEINRKAARLDRPGAAAEPVARFEDERLDAGVAEPPRRADPRRPAADHRNLDAVVRHARSRSDRTIGKRPPPRRSVTPAQAGVQSRSGDAAEGLDPRLRGDDKPA